METKQLITHLNNLLIKTNIKGEIKDYFGAYYLVVKRPYKFKRLGAISDHQILLSFLKETNIKYHIIVSGYNILGINDNFLPKWRLDAKANIKICKDKAIFFFGNFLYVEHLGYVYSDPFRMYLLGDSVLELAKNVKKYLLIDCDKELEVDYHQEAENNYLWKLK